MSNSERVKEFYINDIVFRFDKTKRIIFGVVVDSYEAASDVSSEDDYQMLQKGQIRVLWNNSSHEQVWRQSKVRLLNRCIIPADIVRRFEKGKETQRGYCKEVKQTATVQIVGTDKIVEHVSSDRLHSLRPFENDDAVCFGNKYGRIESLDQLITMQSKDGSVVEILTSINHDLDDYWLSKRNRVTYISDTYYPGQEIICVPFNFEQPNWIKKTKVMKRNIQNRQRFTIQHVSDVLIELALYSTSTSSYSQVLEITKDDIKKLKVIERPGDTCLELPERRLLKLGSQDVLLKKKDWVRKLSLFYRPDVPKVRHNVKSTGRVPLIRSSSLLYPNIESSNQPPEGPEEDWWTEEDEDDVSDDNCSASSQVTPLNKTSRKKHYPPKAYELAPGHTLPVEVICVESKVTVVWQDGTEEKDIPSTQLYYSISLDDHEFFPGEWVVRNEKDENGEYGVVQHVNYIERTASIKWFSCTESNKKPEEVSVQEMSVYDLKKHSKFGFRPGSTVRSKPAQEGKIGKVIDSSKEGYVIVHWLDNKQENCWPQDIEYIPDNGSYDYSSCDGSSDDDGPYSWETESIESYAGDLSDETALQSMAARLDFVRSRIIYLKDAFKQHTITENFAILKDLLLVYENSSYLDKLLGTSFFTLKSKHFQALLSQAKEKAKAQNIELKGRLFSSENLCTSSKFKVAEKDNINKMIKLENRINAQIEKKDSNKEPGVPTTPLTPDCTDISYISQENLCVELLSMLKIRMDLAYAEIISRIGGNQALTVMTKATENVVTPASSTPLPSCPTTPDDSFSSLLSPLRAHAVTQLKDAKKDIENVPYCIIDEAPILHHYYTGKFEPLDLQKFVKAVQKEYNLFKDSLPPGVWVRSFGNRIDLLCVMIQGPAKTPYEDGLFLFDIQLSVDYPRSPPSVYYISYSTERLNPNLYVEGKVCVSLLGTWMGRGTEVWGPNSTLLQLIVSIQGLILVAEPYYNEAGYEKQNDTQQGYENSRTYNELVILKLVQSMTELISSPPEVFKREILHHFRHNGHKLCQRLERFCSDTDPLKPDFALLPVSKGLKLSLSNALRSFQTVLKKVVSDVKPGEDDTSNVLTEPEEDESSKVVSNIKAGTDETSKIVSDKDVTSKIVSDINDVKDETSKIVSGIGPDMKVVSDKDEISKVVSEIKPGKDETSKIVSDINDVKDETSKIVSGIGPDMKVVSDKGEISKVVSAKGEISKVVSEIKPDKDETSSVK